MTQKLTPWFPGHIKPVRKGVYMLMCDGETEVGYQYWDGKYWCVWCKTPKEAKQFSHWDCPDRYQNDKWRGLTERAK